jgi:undecaprenyl-diphosphatase
LGATILEGRKIAVIPTSEILPLFLGILTAMTVGYLAIGAMMKIIRRGKLYYFAPYCILVGILLLIML